MAPYRITLSEPTRDSHFFFEGNSEALTAMLRSLESPECRVSMTTADVDEITLPLLLAADPKNKGYRREYSGDVPWLVWNRTDDANAQKNAYQHGALCVLPAQLHPTPLVAALGNAALLIAARDARQSAAVRQKRKYNRGERIFLEEDRLLEIRMGVIRCTSVHPDGSEVLIGFYGKGDILIAHDAHACHVEMTAHTALIVEYRQWSEAASQPHFYERLKERICHMELWSSMQARSVLEERLLGLLQVIGSKFSRKTEQGMQLDIKVTHEQLAGAIGATRTTVTRLLGNLRRADRLATVKTEHGEFFVITDVENLHQH